MDLSFYRGKTVFITGHTGFKGSWMSFVLLNLGAKVIGYSLSPSKENTLFQLLRLDKEMISISGDIRDYSSLNQCLSQYHPEIVIHMAAQPLVRKSYQDPAYTYEVNVMGTVNLFESIRQSDDVKSVVNVTTDKVYQNHEWVWGYRETDALDGYDPYSNSKSCSELVTKTYCRSFLDTRNISVSTCRAGNVIGGGDFSQDRIIPDCVRAVLSNQPIFVRNPHSIRPYQHVLEPVCAYLYVAMMQYLDSKYKGSYNIGPEDKSCITTGELVSLFCKYWGENAVWKSSAQTDAPKEAAFLKLDNSKMKHTFPWRPIWNIEQSLKHTVDWYQKKPKKEILIPLMEKQIQTYLSS